jgi:Na+/alanine symporter
VRYLSGLLLAIGLAFWSLVPKIESAGQVFRLLTFVVVIGGLARLASFAASGVPSRTMQFALLMELCVTPLLCVWQYRLEQRSA